MGRWMRILIEAAKQSKRYHLPKLDSPMAFASVLNLSASTKIVFAERNGGPLESALAGEPILCLVGPEGGWTDAEREQFTWTRVSMGPLILLAETAAIAALAVAANAWLLH